MSVYCELRAGWGRAGDWVGSVRGRGAGGYCGCRMLFKCDVQKQTKSRGTHSISPPLRQQVPWRIRRRRHITMDVLYQHTLLLRLLTRYHRRRRRDRRSRDGCSRRCDCLLRYRARCSCIRGRWQVRSARDVSSQHVEVSAQPKEQSGEEGLPVIQRDHHHHQLDDRNTCCSALYLALREEAPA